MNSLVGAINYCEGLTLFTLNRLAVAFKADRALKVVAQSFGGQVDDDDVLQEVVVFTLTSCNNDLVVRHATDQGRLSCSETWNSELFPYCLIFGNVKHLNRIKVATIEATDDVNRAPND